MSGMWKRTLAYLGLVEEYEDEYAPEGDEAPPPPRRPPEPAAAGPRSPDSTNVRRIAQARPERSPSLAPAPDPEPSAPPSSGKVHVTNPTTFNDVEEVGERFRNGIPVIMNLAGASESVAKRMLDFASGLIFGLDGRIERVGDRVFLLTPAGVDVSSEERRRLGERGFFNQA